MKLQNNIDRHPILWLLQRALPIVLSLGFAVATAQTPTQQQIDLYKNLPPDQQKAIMESLSKGGSGSKSDQQLSFPQTVQPRGVEQPKAEGGEDRLQPHDTILLYLEIRKFEGPSPRKSETSSAAGAKSPAIANAESRTPVTFTPERTAELEQIRDRIRLRNPFKLDDSGALYMPETGPVMLAGLTVDEAEDRLSVNEQLKDFDISIVRLPVKPQDAEGLKPFGYDLFAGSPTTFAPATDVPVPADYVIGPGDSLQVQLIGNTKGNYSLTVDREGRINFPELGPISVGGLRFEAMRKAIERRVHEQMIGTQASVTMGELRSIRIFVLGDAERPGSYTVSGLSTMTNALFVCGGVKTIGSLRNVELKRNGTTVTKLDLYDLLLKGDTRNDARLLPGDVIFINPVGPTVGISGEVRRPAIYELNGETSVKDLVDLAGGLTAKADPTLATVERIDAQMRRVTLDVNLNQPAGLATSMRAGDVVRIPGIRPVLQGSIALQGYVYRPGEFQYRSGMRLSDLISSVEELKPNADQHYVLIRRESLDTHAISVFSADLAKALADKGSKADIELAPRDRVYVFDLESGRDSVIDPLMRELQLQSNVSAPTAEVRVGGKVKVPGRYPLEPGMRISDLIRAGGSLDEAAYQNEAELTRYTVVNGDSRQTELIKVNLSQVRAGDPEADLLLKPFDYLVIKEVPLWGQQEIVEIRGEVRFPGQYPIHRGETLRSVIERAGGLTDSAFAQGAVFTRVELKEREREQITTLANRMQADITQLSLQTAQESGKDVGQALAAGQSVLAQLKATKPVGRLVIDLEAAVHARPGSDRDLVLKDGDLLVIPRVSQEVTVLGEVQSPTSHLFRSSLDRDDYIGLSGGLSQRADKKRIYVVKADGSVVAKHGHSWFSQSSGAIAPGDTIVVPLDAERMRPLPMWQSVTTIIYNLAIAAAAVHSF